MLSGEAQMWCAVIDQAIDDAKSKRTSTQALREKQEAIDWLLIPNDDFTTACSLAGLDAVAVRERITGGGQNVFEKSRMTSPPGPRKR